MRAVGGFVDWNHGICEQYLTIHSRTKTSRPRTCRYCIKYEYITYLVTGHGDGLGGEGQVGRGVDYEVHVGGVDRIVRSNHHGRSAVEDLRVYDVQ